MAGDPRNVFLPASVCLALVSLVFTWVMQLGAFYHSDVLPYTAWGRVVRDDGNYWYDLVYVGTTGASHQRSSTGDHVEVSYSSEGLGDCETAGEVAITASFLLTLLNLYVVVVIFNRLWWTKDGDDSAAFRLKVRGIVASIIAITLDSIAIGYFNGTCLTGDSFPDSEHVGPSVSIYLGGAVVILLAISAGLQAAAGIAPTTKPRPLLFGGFSSRNESGMSDQDGGSINPPPPGYTDVFPLVS